jgi:hypothetical protein
MRLGDPVDVIDLALDLVSQRPQGGSVVTVDTDDDGCLGTGQDFLDAFVEIGLDVTVEAGVGPGDGWTLATVVA